MLPKRNSRICPERLLALRKRRILLTTLFLLTLSVLTGGESIKMAAASSRVSRESQPRETTPPFYLGVWVGANPLRWGDLPGTEGEAGIQAICSDLAAHGMNALWVSGFDGWNAGMAQIPIWLETAQQYGLKVVIQGSGGPFTLQKDVPRPQMVRHLRNEVIPTWRSLAQQFGNHPALLAYAPAEEIGDKGEEGERHTLAALAQVGEVVEKVDSVHPVITIHSPSQIRAAEAEVKMRGRRLGVMVTSLYVFMHTQNRSDAKDMPWGTPDEATRGYLEWVSRYVNLGRSVGIPAWVIGQAYESRRVSRQFGERLTLRMPTEAEMRFQIWGAILNGAKGLFFFSYQSLQPPPPDVQAALEEWEIGTGMWTLKGDSTFAYEEAMEMAERLHSHLPLLGRLEMETNIFELDPLWILAARFRDPFDRNKYIILLNRDVTQPQALQGLTTKLGTFKEGVALRAGDGAIFRLNPKDNTLEPYLYNPLQ